MPADAVTAQCYEQNAERILVQSMAASTMPVHLAAAEIMSCGRFNANPFTTDEQIDEWLRTTRHKVMYKDESKID